ncbi:MAG: DNA alkylation repair protein, partial [Candidatus Zixiibacteriota bacterium]
MNLNQVMTELKKLGTAQTAKIYRRHGAGENLYGVNFANLKVLQKKLKTDQALAEQLWETGNVDARCLATMVADPVKFPDSLADRW